MRRNFWQSRITLIVLGVALGFVARAMLGVPESELPPKPQFNETLAEEVPLTLPIIDLHQ